MILVTGASGFIGRKLVERLVAGGHPVRVLLPAQRPHHPLVWFEQVQSVIGSIQDAETLHQAMLNVHTVFHLASAQWWGRQRDLQQIDVEGTRSVITAARSARIGRIHIMSHLGAAPSSAYTLQRIKGQTEDLVRSSGLAYTIFRSGIVFGREDSFVNGIAMLLRTNPFFFIQPGQGDHLLHPLYIDNLIEALIRSMENLNTVDQTLEIGGPEYVSFNEMVRTIMRVSQAQRSLVSIPPYTMRSLTGLMNRFIPHWPMTGQWLDILAGNRTAPLGNLYDMFGIHPVRFEDTLVTYMPQRGYFGELMRGLFRRRVHRQ